MILLTVFLCKIYSLGLNLNPVSIQALLDPKTLTNTSDVKIVRQNRKDSQIKPRSVLEDMMCYSGDGILHRQT
jgi:hypothetical protein